MALVGGIYVSSLIGGGKGLTNLVTGGFKTHSTRAGGPDAVLAIRPTKGRGGDT